MIRDAPLDPDRLPNARKRAVPALLAERDFGKWRIRKLVRIVNRAVDLNPDLVATLPEVVGRIERERQEPADMHPEEFIIYPDTGDVEDGAEPDKQPIALPSHRNVEVTAVNAGTAAHSQIGKLRLPGRGYGDTPPLHRA